MNAVYVLMQNLTQAPHSQMVLFAGYTQIVFWIAVIYIRIRSAHIRQCLRNNPIFSVFFF